MNSALQSFDFHPLVDKMAGRRVLVVGDIMLDKFVYGAVDRISPESPVPVLSVKREDTMLGGAGNALASLAGLLAAPHIISLIGDDAEGRVVRDLVKALGPNADGLVVDSARPTTVKTRFLAGHQQLLRTDSERIAAPDAALESKLIKAVEAAFKTAQAVLVSDYGKGLLTPTLLKAIMAAAKQAGIPVIVDPKGKDYVRYAGATAVTPNKKELAEATGGMDVSTDESVIAAASSLMKAADIACVFATRSKDGLSVVQRGREADALHLRSKVLEVFDVSGAGDVVIATIAAAMAAGASLEEAGILANIAGGIAVSKVGTTPIRAEELHEALSGEVSSTIFADCDWNAAQEQVNRWKAKGLKIGFTNGCFDILHAGHVGYLAQARGLCDKLIVGLNTDSSVWALKGPDRPVHDETARAAVLAALGAVDMVVMFGGESAAADQTAGDILRCLKPDLYVKGGDYTPDQIPETPVVEGYGGEVKALSLFEGHSTSGSIKKINKDRAA
ncbi:MAG TPA: bifunctional heptose 7-phosphate kinase/heptose 1-phosphate adenyltransferase [Alphaproteobacteria bacterium]|nr:bifunctional heptose 7-phosphate kinase/heptose 1-phosphate adenyltransferase [Alphaproteobacteria bacterium]